MEGSDCICSKGKTYAQNKKKCKVRPQNTLFVQKKYSHKTSSNKKMKKVGN